MWGECPRWDGSSSEIQVLSWDEVYLSSSGLKGKLRGYGRERAATLVMSL